MIGTFPHTILCLLRSPYSLEVVREVTTTSAETMQFTVLTSLPQLAEEREVRNK